MCKITFNLVLAALLFVMGVYFVVKYPTRESFDAMALEAKAKALSDKNAQAEQFRCADLLIQDGAEFYLYNSKLMQVPSVNPLRFNNLEEYIEFTEWQRSQGIVCPILFLQKTEDAQNNTVYKVRPSPTNTQSGYPDYTLGIDHAGSVTKLLDASRDDPPYNMNSYPAYDPYNQDIGLDTPLDKMFHETNEQGVSPNPMDTNWAGHAYTDGLIKAGVYRDREIHGLGHN